MTGKMLAMIAPEILLGWAAGLWSEFSKFISDKQRWKNRASEHPAGTRIFNFVKARLPVRMGSIPLLIDRRRDNK